MSEKTNILTCVYCGQEHLAGTPASGSDVEALTSHIKSCGKHPMREAEVKIKILRAALEVICGASTEADLRSIEAYIDASPASPADKAACKVGINALLQTLPK